MVGETYSNEAYFSINNAKNDLTLISDSGRVSIGHATVQIAFKVGFVGQVE